MLMLESVIRKKSPLDKNDHDKGAKGDDEVTKESGKVAKGHTPVEEIEVIEILD